MLCTEKMKLLLLLSFIYMVCTDNIKPHDIIKLLSRFETMEKIIKDQNQRISMLEEQMRDRSRHNLSKRQNQGYIAFSVRLTRDLPSTSTNRVVKMQEIKLNEGNGYNSSTGIFTCPEAGLYFFSWTLESMNSQLGNICLNVNGKDVQSTLADLNPHHFQSSSGTEIVRLLEGDLVCLKTCNNYISYVDDIESYFIGVWLSD